jgi:RNA polymerase sigma factor (sigma-70 family)
MPVGAPSNSTPSGRVARLRPRALLRAQRDERLVAQLRAGNERALEVLVDRYRGRLLGFCRGMLGSNEDAEDVLQEVFVAAHDALLADSREIHVRPWLYRIARNRCLNHLRRPRPDTDGSLDDRPHENGITTEERAEKRQELRDLVAGIRALPETQRNALLLRELEALSYDEIAASLDTTVPAVKSLLVRARISLARARRQAARGVAAVAGLAPVLWLRRWVGAKLGAGGGAGGAGGGGAAGAGAGGGGLAATGAISTKAVAVAVGAALVGGGTAAVGGGGVPSPEAVVAAVTGNTGDSEGAVAPARQGDSPGRGGASGRGGANEGESVGGRVDERSGARAAREDAQASEEDQADGDATSADGDTTTAEPTRRERLRARFYYLRQNDPEAARRLVQRIRRYRLREQSSTVPPAPESEPTTTRPRPRPSPEPAPRPRPRPRPRPAPPPPPPEEPPESPPGDEDGSTLAEPG